MKRAAFLLSAGTTAISLACPAAAQNGAPPPGTPTGNIGAAANDSLSASSTGIQDIVVTAQRRSENLQRAALPVSAVSGAALQAAGVVDTQSLTNALPALQISAAAGPYNLFYLRGVGSFNVNPFSDSPVSFNVDGIAISRPSSTSGLFFDIDRVEVLKGPQGTLYGRNATGGAINVITNAPKLSAFGLDLSASYGNYDAIRAEGAINVPISDKAAVRAAFLTSDHDGYLSDGTSDDKSRAGRLRLLFDATPDLTINLGADYYHQGGRGGGAVTVLPGFIHDRIGNSDPRAQAAFGSTPFIVAGSTLIPLPNTQHQDNEFWGVNASIEWRTSVGTLTILPAYRHNELSYTSTVPGNYAIENSHSEQRSIEARLASDADSPLSWIVGGYYLNEAAYSAIDYNNTGFNLSHSRAHLPIKSLAGFGRLTFSLSDRFRLTGGVRYTRDRKSLDANGVIANVICPVALATGTLACQGTPGLPYSDMLAPAAQASLASGTPVPYGTRGALIITNPILVDQNRTFKKTTFRAAAEYDVGDRNLLYASVETGFKAGGFYIGNIDPTYRPETITAYTIGSKNRFFDQKLQINLEAFYWRYKDQQVSFITQDAAGAIVFATQNVGRSSIKGVEADVEFSPVNDTLLGVNVQYLDATYKSFVYNLVNLGGPPTTTCPFTANGAFLTVDCSSRTAPQSPKWTVNLDGRQTIALGEGRIVLMAQTKYQSSSYVGIEYLPEERQKAFWTSGVQATYSAPDDRWSIGAFVNNIENARIKGNAIPQPLVGQSLVGTTLRAPRLYGVRAGVHF